MNAEKELLLAKYEANLADGGSRNHYISYVKKFLKHANAMDKESVNKYVERLRREGKSPGTVNFAFRVVRTLFNANKLDWPFRRGEGPQIGQRDEFKPALKPDDINIMITAAKNGNLGSDAVCFLALSTVYGLRREEMCDLRAGDVNLKAKTIFISTKKHGRERYHLIPDEILPYLAAHDFEERFSLTEMSKTFWRVVNGSGLADELKKIPRLGWHSIRRTVKTLLDKSGIDGYTVHDFMRWKGVERDFAMDVRYHASHFVGTGGTTVIADEAESDKEVFEKHPLLAYWR